LGDAAASRVFPSGLVVAGALHIIHNMSWFVDSALLHFTPWLDNLKHLVTLLHYRHNRQRYIDHCVLKSPYAYSAHMVHQGVSRS
jgi:hypothetical protein